MTPNLDRESAPEPEDVAASDPDTALMLRVRDSEDRQAFAELLNNNHRDVMNLAWRYFNDRQRAEDVTQEVFLRVYAARKNYRPEARFRTWLLRIATNHCISVLRKKRVQAYSLTVGDDERERDVHDDSAADPSYAPEQRELQARVRAAVDALPERQRMAIILSRFHGLSYPELETTLGLSRQALKSLLHRAREALKEQLSDYWTAGDNRPESGEDFDDD